MTAKKFKVFTAQFYNGHFSFAADDKALAADHARHCAEPAWGRLVEVRFVGWRESNTDTSDLGKFVNLVDTYRAMMAVKGA